MKPLGQSHDARTSNSPRPPAGEGLGEREASTALNHAKTLRANQTEVERRLWYHLRAHRFMDLKFKRQKPMGCYIVDFVCEEHRLIVEIDAGNIKQNRPHTTSSGMRGYVVKVIRCCVSGTMM